mmetsp:Transcript_74231/g.197044  ORF Transcript_74231/g.197044 Transcript_74231/m.197044 type:complete len:162 (-) Transcript_74231:192-677(-)
MAAVPALGSEAGDEELEEELEDLPAAEKAEDPLHGARIRRTIDGQVFNGVVEEIEVGKVSRDRLYRIKYEDGDGEHLTAEMVEEWKVADDQEDVRKKPAMKKPAAAQEHPNNDEDEEMGEPEPAPKAKAKGKAKAKAKAVAKGKAKAKAKPKAVVKKPAKK